MSYLDREAAELEDNDVEYEAREFRAGQNSVACGNVYSRLDSTERILNIPVSYPPVIGNFQKEVIQSYLDEERDRAIIAAQKLRQAQKLTLSTGTIRVFFPEKGYGFIKPNCGGLDVWFHIQDRVNKDYFPREGESLTYLTRLGPKGTLVAKQWDSNSAVPNFEKDINTIRGEDRNSFNCSGCNWPMKPNGNRVWECLNPNCSTYQLEG